MTASEPFLCSPQTRLPTGWGRTDPSPGTTTCLAFDPNRHTVVASLNTRLDRKLVEAVRIAGFQRFDVPGSDTGFFVRDRQGSSCEQRTAAIGLAR